MTLLIHAGVCMSYTATWDHLLALTQQANLVSEIQSDHWKWAYDKVNIHRSTRHGRQGEYYSNDIYRISLNKRRTPNKRRPRIGAAKNAG